MQEIEIQNQRYFSMKEVFATEAQELELIIRWEGNVEFLDGEYYAFDEYGKFTAIVEYPVLFELINQKILVPLNI